MSDRRPFEPLDGVEARWRKLYDLVLTKQAGEEITYREVEELLDCDRAAALGAMDYARERLIQDGHIAVRTVDRFGWVRMTAAEQITFAKERRLKAARQIERGIKTLVTVQQHREELSPFDRERLDREQASQVRHVDLLRRSKRTLARIAQIAAGKPEKRGEVAS